MDCSLLIDLYLSVVTDGSVVVDKRDRDFAVAMARMAMEGSGVVVAMKRSSLRRLRNSDKFFGFSVVVVVVEVLFVGFGVVVVSTSSSAPASSSSATSSG